MQYSFPTIRHINDVLPAIEGNSDFYVTEKISTNGNKYSVINYRVGFEESFPQVKTVNDAIKRECRGLIFDDKGDIVSRPYHKFFNVNQLEETKICNIDMSIPNTVMEKVDGSMIRPFMLNGELCFGTKMGITDVSMMAEKYINNHIDKDKMIEYVLNCLAFYLTPIFEYVGPFNRVVIQHSKENMILTGIRHMYSGKYYSLDLFDHIYKWDKPKKYESIVGALDDFVNISRKESGAEGYVIRFNNNHMVKMKNDWYVLLHKTKERISNNKDIAELILNGEIDDVYPILGEDELHKLKSFEHDFHNKINSIKTVYSVFLEAALKSFDNKKDFALKCIPTVDKYMVQMFFKLFDMGATYDNYQEKFDVLFHEMLLKQVSTNKSYEEFFENTYFKNNYDLGEDFNE